ncbi:MAG: hypothetical protein ACXWL2_00730 [Candidatus Chromulinivorax sp.]
MKRYEIYLFLWLFTSATAFGVVPLSTKNSANKTQATIKSKYLIPITKTIFFNFRCNEIKLIITTSSNKNIIVVIKPGMSYSFYHANEELKKVTYSEKNVGEGNLSKTDLDTYAVFGFNYDKIEKYNFIDINQKNIALQKAHEMKNEALFYEIENQTIYYF